ncbi:Protein translocase subunit secA [Phytophthora megakarya]|uniref:Protein translocase subunit secA n=1 Tax=Phytophthora megakarya TaxID=4795 RepID=A0A225WQG1_9STRA|nr:Protein translocase subunit secA [Phytophthora megakarya]
MDGIDSDKRGIPAFALYKPTKSDEEGLDYSAKYKDIQHRMLDKLSASVTPADILLGSTPETAQLLLQRFIDRSIENARDVVSTAFLRLYAYASFHRTVDEITALLEALSRQQVITFEDLIRLLQQMLPGLCRIRDLEPVKKTIRRLKMMKKWTGYPFTLCKEEWVNEECRAELKKTENRLVKLNQSISCYHRVEKNRDTKTLVLCAWHLHLSRADIADIKDFVRMERSLPNNIIPTIVLVGFSKVMLDIPLRIWANVIVVGPIVHMCAMDLSAEGHAPPHVPSRARPGKNGTHGTPGRYGGNFVLACQKLGNGEDIHKLLKSTGQQGGVGQNGGRGDDGIDAKYDIKQFKDAAEEISKRLSTLQKWESANKVLSIIAASVIPEVGPAVGAVVAIIGGSLIRSFGRSTRTELHLSRESVKGSAGTPPGRRGNGGYGGVGGLLYVFESGKVTLKWYGSSGSNGEPGKPGTPSKDGRASIAVEGKIIQIYNSCGKQLGTPQITATVIPVVAPQPLNEHGFTPGEPASPVMNPMRVDTAKKYYKEAFAQLENAFSHCNFANVEMEWT